MDRMDEGAKSASYLSETLLDPETAFSGEPTKCSLHRAFQMDKTIFDWFEDPAQKHRLYRFGVAMEGSAKFEPPDLALNGAFLIASPVPDFCLTRVYCSAAFDWKSIADGALVVDVGGGVGACSTQVAKTNENLKFVVQDRLAVIADGEKVRSRISALQTVLMYESCICLEIGGQRRRTLENQSRNIPR